MKKGQPDKHHYPLLPAFGQLPSDNGGSSVVLTPAHARLVEAARRAISVLTENAYAYGCAHGFDEDENRCAECEVEAGDALAEALAEVDRG